ncbi:MAG: pyridoxamine 5'-phosphate oxidase family protein [Leucobacter sp.]
MSSNENPVRILDEQECWERLASQQIGRLVTRVGDVVDIVPINFVADGRSIVFRTAAGDKLAELTINPAVVFEVDSYDATSGWSVVLHGHAKALEKEADVAAAEALPLRPFVPTLKPTFVRVNVDSLSGRTFQFGEETRREDVQNG